MAKDFLVSGVFRGYKARNELTEIQYLQIEKIKREHTPIKAKPMKVWCLNFLSVWIRQMNRVQENNYLLIHKLFEFAVEWIPGSRSNSQKLSSVQKLTCITAIADKKIIRVFCMSGILCSPPQSAVQIK